jgi:membrane protease YdiL (CAAX protease family)
MNKKSFPFRFFIITFLWSWIWWLPLILISNEIIPQGKELLSIINLPISIIAAFGPAIGACISLYTLKGKGSIGTYLKSFLSMKFGWKVWITIFLVLGLSTFIPWFLPELFGEQRLHMFLPNIYIFPLYWIIMVFFGGGQEEIGWRGYILPYMESKFGYFMGSLILALVWACWHIPLWFIAGTNQTYMNFIGFIMLTIGYSFFFPWVVRASGNRPFSALIAHGTANAFIPLFPVIIMNKDVTQIRYWIWVSVTLIIGIIVMVIYIRKCKYKKN